MKRKRERLAPTAKVVQEWTAARRPQISVTVGQELHVVEEFATGWALVRTIEGRAGVVPRSVFGTRPQADGGRSNGAISIDLGTGASSSISKAPAPASVPSQPSSSLPTPFPWRFPSPTTNGTAYQPLRFSSSRGDDINDNGRSATSRTSQRSRINSSRRRLRFFLGQLDGESSGEESENDNDYDNDGDEESRAAATPRGTGEGEEEEEEEEERERETEDAGKPSGMEWHALEAQRPGSPSGFDSHAEQTRRGPFNRYSRSPTFTQSDAPSPHPFPNMLNRVPDGTQPMPQFQFLSIPPQFHDPFQPAPSPLASSPLHSIPRPSYSSPTTTTSSILCSFASPSSATRTPPTTDPFSEFSSALPTPAWSSPSASPLAAAQPLLQHPLGRGAPSPSHATFLQQQ